MLHLELLDAELGKFQLELPSQQKRLLAHYCDELARWNKKINLTGLTGGAMVRRLVVEPAWIARQLSPAGVLADIGSGNGSPGIPFRVVAGFEQTHLIEARVKRASFLRHLTAELHLAGVTIHRGRFEEMGARLRGINWITLQGMALDAKRIHSMSRIASPTATVVWITSGVTPPFQPTRKLEVPVTGTEVLLFRLDHF